MIISENTVPDKEEFELLLNQSKGVIAGKALDEPDYFLSRTPELFECDIYNALLTESENTPFADSIKLVSGHKFPDIVANKFYGIEVKSTTGSKWKSTGNSVREGTRIKGVERIYLFFGQLINPAAFKWRLYQDCLYDVAVTHSPRYLIDMELENGNTIFDRIDMQYDDLRQTDNPITPIIEYYRRNAKRGEEPWWIGSPEETIPMRVRLWSSLDAEEKKTLEVGAIARFPELFSNSPHKYKNFAAWLAARHGIVSTNTRDLFTAGGKVDITVESGTYKSLPQVFSHLNNGFLDILEEIKVLKPIEMLQYWGASEASNFSPDKKIVEWSNKLTFYTSYYPSNEKAFIAHLIKGICPQQIACD